MALSDAELLAAWRGGDSRAGNKLLARHFDGLYRFLRTKVDEGVEDLIQRSFEVVVRKRDNIRSGRGFRSYLFTVARHLLYEHFEKESKSRARAMDISLSSIAELTQSMGSLVSGQQEQRLMLAAMRRIPVDLQIALELHYWEEMKTRELAEVLEIPEGTVKSRLRRARVALEKELAALAESPELLHTTTSNLESWARSLRDVVHAASENQEDAMSLTSDEVLA